MLHHRRYEPQDVLGRGAQGVVLRVVDREDASRALVAKVWTSTDAPVDLASEFALLSRLRVSGLVRAHDWARDETTGAPFFVEDFVDGPDARAYVQSAKSPTERARRIAKIAADVAATLGSLHAAGFVHGDVKTVHVRVTMGDETKLLDLGCAVTHGAHARGVTAKFTAPEVLAHGPVTPLADLHSLGVLLFDLVEDGRLAPSIEAIATKLRAPHPADRPKTAHDVLAMLGRSADLAAGARPPPIGRDEELRFLLDPHGSSVRYLTGAAGSGKTHLIEEALITTLLAGRHARRIEWEGGGAVVTQLIAFLRGNREAWPFATSPRESTMLFIDDLHRAPRDLSEALVAFACRASDLPIVIVASTDRAPPSSRSRDLGPLDDVAFERLCALVGAPDVGPMKAASAGNPGLVVAASGRVPLSTEAVRERVRALSPKEVELFAAIALLGGMVPRTFPIALLGGQDREDAEAAERRLIVEGLVTRSAESLSLFAPSLAGDLASALGSCARVDRAASAVLSLPAPSPRSLLALARGPFPATRRALVLTTAATLARAEDHRAEETEALSELMKDPAARSVDSLLRLERLLRDAGSSAEHAEVVEWLWQQGGTDPNARSLALRRRAERAARGGRREEALALAEEAADASKDSSTLSALALATKGAVHLYASEWPSAEAALGRARSMLAVTTLEDREEVARLDHNFGVVSLVRGDLERAVEALERSLQTKRALRDLAGVRSSLLNLGIAQTKARRFAAARTCLDEGLALARTLGQRAGTGWCLVALCDLEVRRGDAPSARRFAAEVDAVLDALPPPVRADLSLALAEADLLEGRGGAARAHVDEVASDLRHGDALVDARCFVVLGRACLATLPADRHQAAKLAVASLRRARAAGLAEIEEPARALLGAARGRRVESKVMLDGSDPLWSAVEEAAAAPSVAEAAYAILRVVVRVTRAERAFVARMDSSAEVAAAWGIDVDGISIPSAKERVSAHVAGATAAPTYVRDAEMPTGRGSRMSVARGQVVLVVEHRFVTGAFDAIASSFFERAAMVAALALRESGASAAEPVSAGSARVEVPGGSTTVLPLHEARRTFPSILGGSRALRQALARLDAAIDTDLPVLVWGETGTGKELFVRALHDHGRRAAGPFVAVNCAAVPEALFEAELFGHVRGAFTGADRPRPGLLARAEGGTLFLDEVGDLAPARQATLLRALETRRFRQVGSDDERAFDVRIVAATHHDLAASVRAGTFRSDLLYRLRVLEIHVPPLRDREGDVPLLARYFLDEALGEREAGSRAELTPRALDAITHHTWPGNVRELSHHMQRLAALRAPRIDWQHLPRELRSGAPSVAPASPAGDTERAAVERALSETGGNISHAAVRLGITRHGLKKRMLRLGMRSKG